LGERLATAQSQRDTISSQLAQEGQRAQAFQAELAKKTVLLEASSIKSQALESERLAMRVRLETSEQVTEQIRAQVAQIIQSVSNNGVTH
jgi:ribosomal protein L9